MDNKTDDDRGERGLDDTIRKSHYGAGRQPWDDIVDMGWGPAFAAGSILKYLRRDKRPEHSIESAKWYFAQLMTRAKNNDDWARALDLLLRALTFEELSSIYVKKTRVETAAKDQNQA